MVMTPKKNPQTEKTTVNMDQDVSDSCTCRCKDHNHFTFRAALTLFTVERQMRETRGCDKDKLFSGMLTALQNEAAVTHNAAASASRTRTPFQYTIKDKPVCKSVLCRVYRVSATRLKRIQKLLRSGVCAHAS